MTTLVVVAFLIVHGLLHLAIWLPKPAPENGGAPPFEPDHSAVLTRVMPEQRTHQLALDLAWASTIAFVGAGIAVAVDVAAAPLAAVAAVIGLVLKGLYFNPWLAIGVGLDLAVLASALFGWPVSL